LSVLLLDPLQPSREAVARWLGALGATVVSEADAARTEVPATDVVMIDGRQGLNRAADLLAELRLRLGSAMPAAAVLQASRGGLQLRHATDEVGFDHTLGKPMLPRALRQALNTARPGSWQNTPVEAAFEGRSETQVRQRYAGKRRHNRQCLRRGPRPVPARRHERSPAQAGRPRPALWGAAEMALSCGLPAAWISVTALIGKPCPTVAKMAR
jgi:CheY-like chemotaxis protein